MKKQLVSMTVLALGLLAALAVGLCQAQGSEPQVEVTTQAAVGTAFVYQGRLNDGGGLANGNYDFQFKLYDGASGGSEVGNTVTIEDLPVSEGLFSVELDFGDVFDGTALWLEIGVRPGESEDPYTILDPRQPLSAAPYAHSLRPGTDIVGSIDGSSTLSVVNESPGLNSRGIYGYASATSGTTFGVYGDSDSESGYGVYGEAPQFGVYGEATRTSNYAYGVYGKAQAGSGAGVIGLNMATTGNAIGVYGSSDSSEGRAVYGYARAGSGLNYGIYGQSDSADGKGVFGYATATSGNAYGVYGFSDSAEGRGLFGWANADSGTTYGVYGRSDSPNGYGGYFSGNVHVNGDLSASGTKAFKIDHPLDPEKQYLYHYSVESSEVVNQYTGNTVLDKDGQAWVQLPDWFAVVNTDFRYQLTPIGGWAPLYIAQEIQNNRFQIAGGEPGIRVSWMVTALRHDPYIQQHPHPVEVDKTSGERGTYLHPELYGQPETKGLDYPWRDIYPSD